MNVTKYADLSQSLAESEKKLYDKISEECASYFRTAIDDSIQEIKCNANSMNEVVGKIQSCKDSYGEAAELVEKLSTTLADTKKNVEVLNSELVQISGTAGNSTSELSEKISKLLELSDNLTVKNKQNENLIEDICKNIQNLGEKYSSSIESVIKNVKELEYEINSTENKIKEYIKQFTDDSKLLSEKTGSSIKLLDDVKNSTLEYMGIVKEENSLLMESFNKFEENLISTYNEQSRMIEELKEEQVKVNKMYMLGLISTIIIIVLQILNIIC